MLDKFSDISLLKKFNDYLHKETGFIFEEKDLDKLNARINKRIADLSIDNLDDYYSFLVRNENELLELINHIIINETTFFRHEEHYAIIAARIKENPERYKFVNILSAGCSTGEEPYSIAMYLKRNLPDALFKGLRITACDISSFNIKIAKAGKYPQLKIDKVKDKQFVNLFFYQIENDEFYEIKSQIKNIINFSVENLFTVEFRKKFNFVFCRNVMIYFSDNKRRQLIEKFCNSLQEDGIFFIAPTESLMDAKDLFDRKREAGATFYCKKKHDSESVKNEIKHEKNTLVSASPVIDEFEVKFSNIRKDYLEIEFNGKFENYNKNKILEQMQNILSKHIEFEKIILIMNDVSYIDVQLLKDVGKFLLQKFRQSNNILLTTNKEQLLRIFEFHRLKDYFELL